MKIPELIDLFKSARWEGSIEKDVESALKRYYPEVKKWSQERHGAITLHIAEKEIPRKTKRLLCNYDGMIRPVHPDVCEWHKAENDPKCKGCDQ